jgi:hypothetical protein
MTTIPTALFQGRPLAPTGLERLVIRVTQALESSTLCRMQRRGARPIAPVSTGDERRTALALGGLGILPR